MNRNTEVKRHWRLQRKHSQAFACTHSMSLTFVSLNVGVLRAHDDLIILFIAANRRVRTIIVLYSAFNATKIRVKYYPLLIHLMANMMTSLHNCRASVNNSSFSSVDSWVWSVTMEMSWQMTFKRPLFSINRGIPFTVSNSCREGDWCNGS